MIKNNNINIIWNIIPDARLVGGCVRDYILGDKPKDYDFATHLLPDEVIKIFKKHDIETIPTGLQHGTVTVIINDENYEITTLRTDDETDGRHAIVSFTDDWEKDSCRRDFTFNALYMDSTGKIYDYHNGINDLKNDTIKFIGNAENRIKEDALRILRYYRFIGKLPSLKGDEQDIQSILSNKDLIKNLSIERVYSELVKIFNSSNNCKVIELLNLHGISNIIFNKEIPIPKILIRNLTHLDIFSYMADKVDYMKHFKTSIYENSYVNKVYNMSNDVDKFIDDITIKKLLLDYSHEEIISGVIKNTINTHCENNIDIVKKINSLSKPIFPIKGQDLLDIGFKQGNIIGKQLNYIKNVWKNSSFTNSKSELLNTPARDIIIEKPPKNYSYSELINNINLTLSDDNLDKLGISVYRVICTMDGMKGSIKSFDSTFGISGYYNYKLVNNCFLHNIPFKIYYQYFFTGYNDLDNFFQMGEWFDEEYFIKMGYKFDYRKVQSSGGTRNIIIVFDNKKDLSKVKLKL